MALPTADLLAPIPGDAPAGADLRYAPTYTQLTEARREEDDAEPHYEPRGMPDDPSVLTAFDCEEWGGDVRVTGR